MAGTTLLVETGQLIRFCFFESRGAPGAVCMGRRCTWQIGQLFGALAMSPRVHRMRMRAGARRALIWGQPGCPAARLLLTFFINSTRLGEEEEEEEEEEECCGAYLLSHCVVVIRPGLRGPGLVRISRI
jgi:hypothetical protein